MIEEWRPVPGYEGLYEVSSYGRVRNSKTYRILKAWITFGYLMVELSGRKRFYVHRLVAETFIPNIEKLPQVNHKDEDKTNNRVDNLEWCTAKYNINYGSRTERQKNTNISSGLWTGMSKNDYAKQYRKNNAEKIREINRRAYLKRKIIQNNV